MRSLWTKIGFGAAGVFAVGMMVLTLGREAKDAAAQALSGALKKAGEVSVVSEAPADIPFVLDGERLGTVRHVGIARERRGDLPTVKLVVDLSDQGARRELSSCSLIPDQQGDFSLERGFRCAEGMTGHMVELGRVQFAPGGWERPLLIEPDQARDLSEGDAFQASADLGGQSRVEARGDAGELVRMLVDRHGANIRIRDGMGRSVLRLLADSNGATLRVRDDQGREIVRMDAGNGGFSLSVDTSGH